MRATHRMLTLLVAGLLAAAAAPAEVFTVELVGGQKIESRYQPKQSDRDENKVLLLTEVGNWIALHKNDIVGITSETESKGFGTVVNTTTIVLGWAPNDAADPNAEQDLDPTERLIRYLQGQSQQPAPAPFTVQQFAEPNSAGGIPIGFVNMNTPPLGPPVVTEPPVAGAPPR